MVGWFISSSWCTVLPFNQHDLFLYNCYLFSFCTDILSYMLPIYTVLDVFESRRWFMPNGQHARLGCDRSNILLNRIIINYNTKHTGLWCLTPLSTIFQLYHDGYVQDQDRIHTNTWTETNSFQKNTAKINNHHYLKMWHLIFLVRGEDVRNWWIQLSRGKGLTLHDRFNSAIWLCLSQSRSSISIGICRIMFYVQ